MVVAECPKIFDVSCIRGRIFVSLEKISIFGGIFLAAHTVQMVLKSSGCGTELYFKNINFLTKTKKCLLCWLLWIQNYQMTDKYLTSNTTFSKKVDLRNIKCRHIYWWGPEIYYSCILLVYPIRPWNPLNVKKPI